MERVTTVGKRLWKPLVGMGERTQVGSIDELLDLVGLNWTVSTQPLVSQRTGQQIRNLRETIRDDNGLGLGVVGRTWHPIQNRDAFGALPELFPTYGLQVAGGGIVHGGAAVWLVATLGKAVEFPTRRLANGELDKVERHLLFYNAHDGSSRTKVAAIPFAFWCSNTLNAAWSAALEKYAVKHTSRGTERLLDLTAGIRAAIEAQERFMAELVELEAQAMKAAEMRAFAEQLIVDVKGALKRPTKKDGSLDKRGDERRENVDQMVRLFEGEGVTCLGRSRMDALQAVTEWVDHHRSRADAARAAHAEAIGVDAFLDGSRQTYRERAVRLLTRR